MITRRRFIEGIAGILAAGVAPAIVRSESIMRVNPGHIVTLEEFTSAELKAIASGLFLPYQHHVIEQISASDYSSARLTMMKQIYGG